MVQIAARGAAVEAVENSVLPNGRSGAISGVIRSSVRGVKPDAAEVRLQGEENIWCFKRTVKPDANGTFNAAGLEVHSSRSAGLLWLRLHRPVWSSVPWIWLIRSGRLVAFGCRQDWIRSASGSGTSGLMVRTGLSCSMNTFGVIGKLASPW